MSETHVAGVDITFDERYIRQRCSWCGVVLLDYDLANMEAGNERPAPWPIGSLVRIDGNAAYVVSDAPLCDECDPDQTPVGVPDDSCFNIDPEVTR